jgi:nucleotide-binding universal stress UspA family protein
MDEQLIDAACKVCQLSGTTEIYFINVIRDLQMPDQILKEFPDIIEKALKERREKIELVLQEKFGCDGVTPHIIIKEGTPTKEILKFVTKEKMDLIIVGHKGKQKSGGVLIQRLARRAGCSLLVIPQKSKLNFERILVPVDFSNYSKMALEKAVSLANRLEVTPEVITQNVYQVPSGYHYTGKSFDDFAKIMKEHAERDYKSFIKDLKLKKVTLKDTYTLDNEEDVIAAIYKKAKKSKADLIIIGAKGRSSTTALFIGSKAEKMVQMDSDIPLMIVRPKGKRAGFMEYLQEL